MADRGQEQRDRLYLQRDDYWLLSLLRAMYVELHDKVGRTHDDEVLYRRLEELIASKRNYFSLVKRFEDFREIEQSFFDKLLQLGSGPSINFQPQPASSNLEAQSNNKIEKAKLELFRLTKSNSSDRSLYYANIICLGTDGRRVHYGVEERFADLGSVKDLLLINKIIKAGFTSDLMVQTDRGPKRLSDFSVLAEEIENKERRWPLFFAYVLPASSGAPDVSSLRKNLGQTIAERFHARCENWERINAS